MATPFSVSRDRIISEFPKCYTPEACLELGDRIHEWRKTAAVPFPGGEGGVFGGKVSKVVVVGDAGVGKTSLIHRFCKDVFDRDYKATIGVDFEIERFEVAGTPFSLQIWDTAGQEKFKCIASTYYRGAEVIVAVFDLADIQTLGHTKQWLEDAARENEPGSSLVFLVGTKTDLVSEAERRRTEADAVLAANAVEAEYWSVSAKTGENVKPFFARLAAVAFEKSVSREAEKNAGRRCRGDIGTGKLIRIERNPTEAPDGGRSDANCC